jgi:acetyl-CoA acetyltransferase
VINAAIAGLGMEGLTRTESSSARVLAARAVKAAADEAGLGLADVDGLIVCRSGSATEADLGLTLQRTLGLTDLALLQTLYAEGASSIAAIQTAAMAVTLGLATTVACVFADARLAAGKAARESFGQVKSSRGIEGLRYSAGLYGGPAMYALAAKRYEHLYGPLGEGLCAIARAARAWAGLNPRAVFREALTREAYFASRWIVEPFRLYDCAVPVNGAIAVIVTTAERARDLAQPPAHILGMGQGHPGTPDRAGFEPGLSSGGGQAKAAAFAQAGVDLSDVDVCEIYDAFTYSTLITLEEYGFCGRGEGREFVLDAALAPGGRLAVNTGGGQLSGYYLQGMTPVSEAVLQARGSAGERQCARHDIVLATNDGGRFDHHACMVLSPHARAR